MAARHPRAVFALIAAASLLLLLPGLLSEQGTAPAEAVQAHLDTYWADGDWIGVIGLLEALQRKGPVAAEHKDALYAAYIAEATPLVQEGRFKEARSLLERAVRLAPKRPEAKDLLAARDRSLGEFLYLNYGGGGDPGSAASWYGEILEITLNNQEATVRTGLLPRESSKPVAWRICEAVLRYDAASLDAVWVTGMNGWNGVTCRK